MKIKIVALTFVVFIMGLTFASAAGKTGGFIVDNSASIGEISIYHIYETDTVNDLTTNFNKFDVSKVNSFLQAYQYYATAPKTYETQYGTLSTSIEDYISTNKVVADTTSTTNKTFTGLDLGLYFVSIEDVTVSGKIYKTTPFLVLVEDNITQTITTKHTVENAPTGSGTTTPSPSTPSTPDEDVTEDDTTTDDTTQEDTTTDDTTQDDTTQDDTEDTPQEDTPTEGEKFSEDMSVRIEWVGDANNFKPEYITVFIYCDDQLMYKVNLSEENNWSFEWVNEKENSVWTVVDESGEFGFITSQEDDGNNWLVLNSVYELPQTGTNANLVSVFAGIGIAFLIIGMIFRKRANNVR